MTGQRSSQEKTEQRSTQPEAGLLGEQFRHEPAHGEPATRREFAESVGDVGRQAEHDARGVALALRDVAPGIFLAGAVHSALDHSHGLGTSLHDGPRVDGAEITHAFILATEGDSDIFAVDVGHREAARCIRASQRDLRESNRAHRLILRAERLAPTPDSMHSLGTQRKGSAVDFVEVQNVA